MSQSTLTNLQEEKVRIEQQLAELSDKNALEKQVRDLEFLKQDYYAKYFSNNIVASRYFNKFK